MKSFLLYFVVILTTLTITTFSNNASAQDIATSKNIFFVQFGGKGNKHSINYERLFVAGEKMNYSFSVGYAPSSNRSFSIPLSFNAFTAGEQHHFDFGVGVVPGVEYEQYKAVVLSEKRFLFVNPTVGYRYQKLTSGLFFKAGVGSKILVGKPNLISPCIQISLGANF